MEKSVRNLKEEALEARLERCKEKAMNRSKQFSYRSHPGPVSLAFAAAVVLTSAPRVLANNKPTEVPAKVIGHLILKDAPGSEMLLPSDSCSFSFEMGPSRRMISKASHAS